MDATGVEDGFQKIKTCVFGRVVTWERFLLTLHGLRAEATPADIAALPLAADDFHRLLQRLEDPGTWPFLMQDIATMEGHWNREVHVLAEFCCSEAAASNDSRPSAPIPRGFGRERYFLHLFSGRRRHGDFQFFFDRLHDLCEGFLIHVISLDVVPSSTWGDLLQPAARAFW